MTKLPYELRGGAEEMTLLHLFSEPRLNQVSFWHPFSRPGPFFEARVEACKEAKRAKSG